MNTPARLRMSRFSARFVPPLGFGLLLLFCLTAGSSEAQDGPASTTSEPASDKFEDEAMLLFDEHSLAGWEGTGSWFRIEDDVIIAGRLDQPIPHNEFLCTLEKFDDFELRLEAKLVGEGDNAGIQFRSRRVPSSSEVSGYQADMGRAWDRPVWGALYDESRRNKMLAEPDAEKIKSLVRPDDWNEFRIRCQGNRIQIYLNGEQTVDYTETDPSVPVIGVIGLQIHSGPPTEAHYRKIRIRSL